MTIAGSTIEEAVSNSVFRCGRKIHFSQYPSKLIVAAELDLRIATRVCDKLAGLRSGVAEIAELVLIQAGAATRRDLLDALAAAAH